MRPEDLLFLLPLRYEDETRVTPVAQAQAGSSVLVEGRIVDDERRVLVVVEAAFGERDLVLAEDPRGPLQIPAVHPELPGDPADR